jgi:phospholipid/cholesterol/gamma-HCH transport system ATP-binding protein
MIQIKDLHKSFDDKKILKGVNLEIPDKKITVILGGSGSGKSVLIKHIMGLLKPDKGQVIIDGVDLNIATGKDLLAIRKKFGMLFQYSALFDSMSVKENIAFPLKEHTKLSNKEISSIILEKLKLVGLEGTENLSPADLSGGMQKRVALARAIVLKPENIVYDEPTSGLDPLMSKQVDDLIVEMSNKLEITSIIISHNIPSAFRIADKIAVLYQGQIIADGTPQEILNSKNEYVKDFLDTGFGR